MAIAEIVCHDRAWGMNASPQNNANIGILFVLAGVFCISINDMFVKQLSGGYPLHQIVLARSGIGQFTLIDLDEICVTNVNRQVHALTETVGQSKTEVMKKRILSINPSCIVNEIDDFVGYANLEDSCLLIMTLWWMRLI